jgi:hypothetical protein
MIGGADLILHGRTKAHDTDILVRGIRSEWPGAMIQHADEVEASPICSFRLPVFGPTELIVYRDPDSYQSWKDHGATTNNQDAMILMIVSDDTVTLVVDHPRSALADIAWDLLDSLRPNRIVLQKAA